MRIGKFFIKWIIRLLFIGIILGGLASWVLYYSVEKGYWGEIPSTEELSSISHMQASLVLDKEGVEIGKFYVTDRESVTFEEFPEHLIHALVATEDVRFFKHKGVDNRSLLRVFFKSIVLREDAGGGSTITQQLAKNLFKRQNYGSYGIVINKLRENIIAKKIEKHYSKEEILTLYLNTVPFSGNTYGVESAAKKFYNVSTKDLNLPQAATLVGTLKANHTYHPQLFPDKALARRNVVISQMVKYDYLTEDEAEDLKEMELELGKETVHSSKEIALYFQEQVKRQATQILIEEALKKEDGNSYDLLKDGLTIHTTLDAGMQEYAEESMKKHMTQLQAQFEKHFQQNPPWKKGNSLVTKEIKKLPLYRKLKAEGLAENAIIDSLSKEKETLIFDWNGNQRENLSTIDSLRHYMKFLNTGSLSINPQTGAILAYVGGIDYRYFQYDHIVQSKRQVGSIFKPIVYAAALEKGLEPCDYFPVKEITYTDERGWTPKNAGKEEEDEEHLNYSMRAALSKSLNTVAVQVLRETGIPEVVQMANKLGIQEEIENRPAIVLGTSSIRIIEMAKAYSAFVNQGKPVNPYFIDKIENAEGEIIYQYELEENPAAMSRETQEKMLEMMRGVVNEGTAHRLRNVYGLRNDIAGKTGTTQNNTDGWFVGLLPELVSVTWVGNDNSQIKFRSTYLGQGSNSALPIFAGMVQQMNKDDRYNSMTQKRFSISTEIRAKMDCPPTSVDGFFKRLFKKKSSEEDFHTSPKKKKKGFFKRLFS